MRVLQKPQIIALRNDNQGGHNHRSHIYIHNGIGKRVPRLGRGYWVWVKISLQGTFAVLGDGGMSLTPLNRG
jgi:hypothetical protein